MAEQKCKTQGQTRPRQAILECQWPLAVFMEKGRVFGGRTEWTRNSTHQRLQEIKNKLSRRSSPLKKNIKPEGSSCRIDSEKGLLLPYYLFSNTDGQAGRTRIRRRDRKIDRHRNGQMGADIAQVRVETDSDPPERQTVVSP